MKQRVSTFIGSCDGRKGSYCRPHISTRQEPRAAASLNLDLPRRPEEAYGSNCQYGPASHLVQFNLIRPSFFLNHVCVGALTVNACNAKGVLGIKRWNSQLGAFVCARVEDKLQCMWQSTKQTRAVLLTTSFTARIARTQSPGASASCAPDSPVLSVTSDAAARRLWAGSGVSRFQ